MQRSRKIILLAHCVLNANAKVGGLCSYPAALVDLVKELFARDIGIIQLPCPEMLIYGSQRWGHVKEQFSHPHFRQVCQEALTPILQQVIDYQHNGYQILGVVGIDGSPSCGVTVTCSSSQWSGDFLDKEQTWEKIESVTTLAEPGVLMEELALMLRQNGVEVPFFAVDEGQEATSTAALLQALE